MAQPGGPARNTPEVRGTGEARWAGAGYADITKLRELCAKHERMASQAQAKAARIQTKIGKHRHVATVLREKGQAVLAKIPLIEQEMTQHERDIKAHTEHTGGRTIGSDVTELHYRIRKLQQKIVDIQHKARTLEHKASIRTQKAAELKIRVDRFNEQANLEQAQADQYRKRADRLQMTAESQLTAVAPPPGAGEPAAPSESPTLPS
ncbi:MAG TPA: hypothetical protein VJS68_00130, partial [Thermoplasmata archaeon]|nr:hypothetical protein [Thermoplasmata archaeon]